MKLRAAFFDLDETLIDASQCHFEALKQVFEAHGLDYAEIERRTTHSDFLGKRLIEIVRIMRDSIGVTEAQLPAEQLNLERQGYFFQLIQTHAHWMPGATEALRYARQKLEVVAMVSSATRAYEEKIIQRFGLEKLIDFYVGEEDVARGKPAPDPFLEAHKRIPGEKKITVNECVVIEDSANGIASATAAGMPVIWVPFFPEFQAMHFTVAARLDSLLEFPAALDRLMAKGQLNVV